jgi:two-component sensor histidine kinase
MNLRLICLLSILLPITANLLTSCKSKISTNKKYLVPNNSVEFYKYINLGDSVYAQKRDLYSFSNALLYFDTAWTIASKMKDSILIAEAYFAKGRVFDAWNKEPKKTIDFFTYSFDIMSRNNINITRTLYIEYLIAHTYEKISDSINCHRILKKMYHTISPLPDSIKIKLDFIPEMALSSTVIKNYKFAELILKNLYKREWIKNNPNRYNYLDHYYLTKARISLYNKTESEYVYIDSFARTLAISVHTVIDSIEYATNLAHLYENIQNYKLAFYYGNLAHNISDRINVDASISNLRNKVLESELMRQQEKLNYENKVKGIRYFIIFLLLLIIITILILLFRLRIRSIMYQEQSAILLDTNKLLDIKLDEITLLNKEMQHRIKNNLQTIYSLLQMQERKSNNKQTIDNLQQARMRIESIALLHSQMLHKGDNSSIPFKLFVQDLTQNIISCYSIDKSVKIHLNVIEIDLPVAICFPLTLILNEWITNSIKYANTTTNTINIYLNINQNEQFISIDYYDSGNIIEIKKKRKIGLGMEVVSLLVIQLKAKLETDKNNIYHYKLEIPNAKYNTNSNN